jgi:multiple sugar transport system substrate-binding protein
MGGVASRAASGHHASHAFLLHLAPLGGRVFDDQWNPIVNNEAGVAAANALKTIVDCGPEGRGQLRLRRGAGLVPERRHGDVPRHHRGGRADRRSVEIAGRRQGRLGAAPDGRAPRQPDRRLRHRHPVANAENKEAAFLLMQWLTSKHGDKLVAMAGGNPSRFSTHADPDVNAKFPHMATFGEALKYADPDWRPIIPVWGKINADLGTTLSKVLTEDLDIQEALDGVAERTRR